MSRRDPSPEVVALFEAIDGAWSRHAQPLQISVPSGCGATRQISGGHVMGRMGFVIAAKEIIDRLNGETVP